MRTSLPRAVIEAVAVARHHSAYRHAVSLAYLQGVCSAGGLAISVHAIMDLGWLTPLWLPAAWPRLSLGVGLVVLSFVLMTLADRWLRTPIRQTHAKAWPDEAESG